MVQKQHHKSNAKKQPHVKKQGKQADNTQFRAQLDALGLKIVQVTADGNCFFRAVADQLEGNEEEHGKYRSTVVQYILKNREMFEPFIEDDAPFEEYCKTMDNDGTWAGHMELQAASLVTRSNICIHRNMSPRWYIRNFDQPGARMIHLSYHDEEHYNSVRLKEDTGDGPARPITIKVDSNLSSSSRQAKAGSKKSKAGTGKVITDAGSIKLVMAGSGCENIEKVEQTLLQMYGDVDAAIEYLIAEKGIEDFSEEAVQSPCNADASHVEILRNRERNLWKRPIKKIHLAIALNGLMMMAVPSKKTRKFQETRIVHVVQKRNTSPVAGQGQRKSLQFPIIELLNPEKVERKRSEAREGLTHLHFLVDLMEGHLIWGLFVSDLLLNIVSDGTCPVLKNHNNLAASSLHP
ncbi:OVARIAN TUMOR DOMAIN-containing deubiquitinating enzyme 7-like isoform X2 [Eucalyptus grandis]|uniref:OVARIAN TUMOR DOMAIN-containing deubiquitinating enzyme 7-like isoform X2 n=1 Tax=Eucalyptus grandis TaxID=71139 RepID=UPI00192E84B4|nr:OVARIAN TUMOR DOMAIN-containing deubiquitinating enzyme 7-like isoform X2 [Eucalyptus grandis]